MITLTPAETTRVLRQVVHAAPGVGWRTHDQVPDLYALVLTFVCPQFPPATWIGEYGYVGALLHFGLDEDELEVILRYLDDLAPDLDYTPMSRREALLEFLQQRTPL